MGFAERLLSERKQHNLASFPQRDPFGLYKDMAPDPWEIIEPCATQRAFPEASLLSALVDLYFDNMNIICPVLHRPSFQQNLETKQHMKDSAFGDVVLLVCAVGARFSTDPRVKLDNSTSWHSSGWRWYSQVRFEHNPNVTVPHIHNIQAYAVCVHKLSSCRN